MVLGGKRVKISMTDKQLYMFRGVQALRRRFSVCEDDEVFYVSEIIEVSNEVLDEILNGNEMEECRDESTDFRFEES